MVNGRARLWFYFSLLLLEKKLTLLMLLSLKNKMQKLYSSCFFALKSLGSIIVF